MKQGLISSIIGGRILRDIILNNWKFIVYIFLLGIIYISLSFMTRNTKQQIAANEEVLRNLRSEYMGTYTKTLSLGKRGEIEKMIEKEGLKLIPPETPPVRVNLKEE